MKTYRFDIDIDCPGCAAKVERALKEDARFESAVLDFAGKKLTVTTDLSAEEVKKLAVSVSDEISFPEEKRYVFRAEIDCAECARKVEEALKSDPRVSHADFSFAKKKLTVKTTMSEAEIKKLCLGVEEDMEFFESDEELPEDLRTDLVRIIAALALFALSWAFHFPLLFIASYVICGYDVIWKAVRNILKGKVFDENFLMALATVGALVLSSYSEAAAVMIFYQIGEYFQTRAVIKSRKSIKSLLEISSKEARLADGTMMSAEKVAVGSVIEIRPGEKIPLDGEVVSGASSLDTKALTGESIPADVTEGSQVLSGSVNLSSVIRVRVTKSYDESTAKKMIDLIENGNEKRSRSEQFITRFSRWYTPLVCVLALAVAFVVPAVTGESYREWIYRAMELLVVSCPCALVLSIPLSYFASIGAFARQGLLVKGSDSVERLSKAGRICFDKTGTLTKGELRVTSVVNLTDTEILPILAALEANSNHPMAKAIVEYAGKNSLQAESITEKPGYGVEGIVNGKPYQAGSARYFTDAPVLAESAVYLGSEGTVIGYVTLSDTVRENAAKAVSALRALGIREMVMISGDREAVCRKVAKELGLDSYHAELLPEGKLAVLKKLCADEMITAYCGDGINDAPALAAADVGISMGGVGSDAAIEQSDLVIISDDPSRIADGIRISRKTERIVKENIVFSLTVKAAVIILSVIGLSSMWLAIFSDVGVSLIAVINAMRAGITHPKR